MTDSERDELLGRLDERTLNITTGLEDFREEMREWQKDQNGDIRALQKWQAKLTGAFGVLAVIVVFFQAEIAEVVKDLF